MCTTRSFRHRLRACRLHDLFVFRLPFRDLSSTHFVVVDYGLFFGCRPKCRKNIIARPVVFGVTITSGAGQRPRFQRREPESARWVSVSTNVPRFKHIPPCSSADPSGWSKNNCNTKKYRGFRTRNGLAFFHKGSYRFSKHVNCLIIDSYFSCRKYILLYTFDSVTLFKMRKSHWTRRIQLTHGDTWYHDDKGGRRWGF